MNYDRITKVLLGIVGAGLWAVVIVLIWPQTSINKVAQAKQPSQTTPKGKSVDYDVLTVHRLNVVNEKGQLQWVIADSSRFPSPVINGKAYHGRSKPLHGELFYDDKGNEIGGMVSTNGNSCLILRDIQGRPRIKLEAYRYGGASIKILDANGNIVREIPGKPLRNIK
jgi:hypothetical protein